jgi:flagellar biosynthesis protein FlhF
MRLRTIRSARVSDAIATLRAELGEDAVILATRRVAGGVEVTAGHEADDEPMMIAPQAMPVAAVPSELKRHNLPMALATRLGGADLITRLEAAFRFDALPGESGPLLLCGPAGAGKTLSCAKLATRMVLAGIVPLLISADGRRAGAAEQLAAFASVLELPLAVAASPAALAKALTRRAPGQPVLVDMPACDPFDDASARRHASLAEVAEGTAVLVLPAGLDTDEAAETARAFHLLGCRYLLPTRLDAARRLGGILAAAAEADLVLTEAGTGADVATGLEPLSAEWLARRLTQGMSTRETALRA